MTGTSTTITHAPWVNLVMAMMTSTTSESTAPIAVDEQARAASPAPCGVMWCLAMPACDSVNDVNTPIA